MVMDAYAPPYKGDVIMKRVFTAFLAIILFSTVGLSDVSASAKEKEQQIYTKGTFSLDEIPEGVTPLYFNSVEEADEYIANINSSILANNELQKLQKNELQNIDNETFDPLSAASMQTYSVLVSQYGDFPISPYEVKLNCNYTTSGDHSGYIMNVDPYTSYEYITLFHTWTENACDYVISTSGKDIYVYAEGTLTYYFVIQGIGDVHSWPVSLSGWVYAIR